MKHRFWIALTLFALGSVCPASAEENSRTPPESLPQPRSLTTDFSCVPDDAVAVVHVRVGSLLEKLKLKSRIDSLLPLKMAWEAETGIPLSDVESITMIGLPGEPGTMAFLLTTAKPFKESALQKISPKDGKKTSFQGKPCVVHAKGDMATCVLSPRTCVVAPTEALLEACLKQVGEHRDDESLEAALKSADQHDFSAWVAMHRLTGMGELGFVPHGVESVAVTIDIGDELALGVSVTCEDEFSREWVAKGMKAGIDVMRGQALMVLGMIDGSSLVAGLGGEVESFKEFQGLPIKLMRLAEKGLQQTKIRTEGATVALTVSMPIDAKTLRSEMLGAVRLLGTWESGNCSPAMPFGIVQTYSDTPIPPNGFQVPPNYLPPGGPLVVPQELHPQTLPPQAIAQAVYPKPYGQPVTNLPPPILPGTSAVVPVVATVPAATHPVPSTPVHPPVQGTTSSVPPGVSPPPATLPATSIPIAPATVPSVPLKVSVANVRKETAMLFTMSNDGKMTFVQKVPAGEAVDLEVSVGQRWIAVFTDKPAGETKTVVAGEKIWLLR